MNITTYTDRTAWQNALGAATIVTEDFADGTLQAGLTQNGGTISDDVLGCLGLPGINKGTSTPARKFGSIDVPGGGLELRPSVSQRRDSGRLVHTQ